MSGAGSNVLLEELSDIGALRVQIIQNGHFGEQFATALEIARIHVVDNWRPP